jgi:hypothetical protein
MFPVPPPRQLEAKGLVTHIIDPSNRSPEWIGRYGALLPLFRLVDVRCIALCPRSAGEHAVQINRQTQQMVSSEQISLWLTVAYGLAVPVIAAIYWRAYGPTNFLWLSDIALAFTLAALLSGNRLLASMPTVGVLELELAWTIDFLLGGRLIHLAGAQIDHLHSRLNAHCGQHAGQCQS